MVLAYGSRVQALKNKIKSAILNNRSVTSVYEATKNTELGIRRQTFFQIANSVRMDAEKILALRELSPNQVITPKYAIRAKTRFEGAYSFHVLVDIYDASGRFAERKTITAWSDRYQTKGDILAKISRMSITAGTFGDRYDPQDVLEVYYHVE